MLNFTDIINEARTRTNYDSVSLLTSEITKYINKVKKEIPKNVQDVIYLTQKYGLMDADSIQEIMNSSKNQLVDISKKLNIDINELNLLSDKIDVTNKNRQIIALDSTVGKNKTDVMKERISEINPQCNVTSIPCFYTKEKEVDLNGFDYVVDAIDTVTSKLTLIEEATRLSIPIISCMGTGNKLNPSMLEITDISKTD